MPPATFGRYEVQEEVGHGGMGAVFRAYAPKFRRHVAIKVLSRQLLSDAGFRARFDREARTVAALEHSAIVPVYDYGEENGEPYLVFRYMEGGNLAERIKRSMQAGGPLPLDEVAGIVDRVAKALDHAHARGIVHRDIKPANIMFDGDGDAWLTDFGIARLAEYTSSLTGKGIIGSPAYMSPEQWNGEPATAASDIYSLGCTVFEALTGRPPFVAESPLAVGIKHMHAEAPSPKFLPQPAMQALARSLAKAPSSRYASGREFALAMNLQPIGVAVVRTPTPLDEAVQALLPTRVVRDIPASRPQPPPSRPPARSEPKARSRAPTHPDAIEGAEREQMLRRLTDNAERIKDRYRLF